MASKFLGKYELIERLGRGGMAEVYRAYQASLERYVAIKLLHPFLADDPEFKERFEREARNVARLRHPNIVQVYDFDFDAPSETYYMVMELVDGQTLKERLAGLTARGEHQAEIESVRISRDAASAMGYAHERGVIHRDIKPPNLIFDRDGRVVLTDFGIAKIVTGGTQLTVSGTMVGTPAYMSPEQGLGEKGDERSDLYSLGVIMFQMVTGRLPYDAESPLAVILKHVNEPIPLIRELAPYISPAFEEIIYKAMAKLPVERYQTAEELIRDLEAVIPADGSGLPLPLTAGLVASVASNETGGTARPLLTPTPIRRLTATPPNFPIGTPTTPILPANTGSGGSSVPPPVPAVGSLGDQSGAGRSAGQLVMFTLGGIILIGLLALLLNGGQVPHFITALLHTDTPTATITPTASNTATMTPTLTPSLTPTFTPSSTLTDTPSPTASNTASVTPTSTPTASLTPSATASDTATDTYTPSDTPTPSDTLPPTSTLSPTPNITATLAAATQVSQNMTSTIIYATINGLVQTQRAQTTPTPNYTETAIACTPAYRILSPDPAATPQILKANIDVQLAVTLINQGDCDWLPGTSLRFDSGNPFAAPLKVIMQETVNVPPGEQAHFVVSAHTPAKGNLYALTGRLTVNPGDRQVDPPVSVPIRVYEAS